MQKWEHIPDFYIAARGIAEHIPENGEKGRIRLDERTIEIPAVLFLFWEQFRQECRVSDAQNSFVQAGLLAELFDESLNILAQEGLLEMRPAEAQREV